MLGRRMAEKQGADPAFTFHLLSFQHSLEETKELGLACVVGLEGFIDFFLR